MRRFPLLTLAILTVLSAATVAEGEEQRGVASWLAGFRQAPGSNGGDLDAVRQKIISEILALAGR